MDRGRLLALCKASLWGACLLLFPICSGTLSAILSLGTVETLFLQGAFMLASLAIPLALVLGGTWRWREIGFGRYDAARGRKALHFLPLVAIFIPVAVQGFSFEPAIYVIGNLFLYLAVGVAEETYFRGIVPRCLGKAFSLSGVILLSSLIFGIGHIASAFTATGGWEVLLTVLNALLFGWLAIETRIVSNSIVPAILLHFLFDFETKIVAMGGLSLLVAEGMRGAVMFIAAVWLLAVIRKIANEDAS